MMHLSCSFRGLLPLPVRILARLKPARFGLSTAVQTLAFADCNIAAVDVDADDHRGLELGPVLQLTLGNRPCNFSGLRDAVWDDFSSSVLLLTSSSLLQLTHDNVLHLLAGHTSDNETVDGVGDAARFLDPTSIASDGAGAVFITDYLQIRKVQLPASFGGRWPTAAAGSAGVESGDQIIVTTLDFEAPEDMFGIACIRRPGGQDSSCLAFSTSTALYRLTLGSDAVETGCAVSQPVVWAGSEGKRGTTNGSGTDARFWSIEGMVADGEGNVFVADNQEGTVAIRRVSPDGAVTAVDSSLGGGARLTRISILPNGYLAVAGDDFVTLMDLKLRPSPITASAAAPAPPLPPPRTLPSDLGALLDRQPDGTADLTLTVGDRAFAVHRGILAARSDYFRQLLEEGLADGSSQQLSLPEADPETFALLLRFMYTGAVDIPSALALSVAELADRLLLPELCREAQERVLAEVRAETVVDRLLWAEARGASFSRLLSGLKMWYLEHHASVMAVATDSVKRLMFKSPDLAMELYLSFVRSVPGPQGL